MKKMSIFSIIAVCILTCAAPFFALAENPYYGYGIEEMTCPHGYALVPYAYDDPTVPEHGTGSLSISYANTKGYTDFHGNMFEFLCTPGTENGALTFKTKVGDSFVSLANKPMSIGYDPGNRNCAIGKTFYILCHTVDDSHYPYGNCHVAVKVVEQEPQENHKWAEGPIMTTKADEDHYEVSSNGVKIMKTFGEDDYLESGSSLLGYPYIRPSAEKCFDQGGYYAKFLCEANCDQFMWRYVPNPVTRCVDDNKDGVCEKCGSKVSRATSPERPSILSVTQTMIFINKLSSTEGVVKYSFDGNEYDTKTSWNVEPGSTHTIKAKVFTPESSLVLDSLESPLLKVTANNIKVNKKESSSTSSVTKTPSRTISSGSKYSSSTALRTSTSVKVPEKTQTTSTKKSSSNETKASGYNLHNKVTYTVQKGDTIQAIASAFKTTEAKIRNKSGLSANDKIKVGDNLVIWNGTEIDNGEPESIEQSPLRSDSRLSGIVTLDGTKYKVGEGDSLIDIADAAGIEFAKFAKGNKIKNFTQFKSLTVLKIK